MDIMLPNGSTVDVPYDIAQYIHCLKNLHTAIECELTLYNIKKQDGYSTLVKIERHAKEYDKRILDGLYRKYKEG